MQVIIAILMIALGMGVDAYYQRRIRIAECDAYEIGYQQGQREIIKQDFMPFQDAQEYPSMAAPVQMPDTFEERLRKHGRAVVRLK